MRPLRRALSLIVACACACACAWGCASDDTQAPRFTDTTQEDADTSADTSPSNTTPLGDVSTTPEDADTSADGDAVPDTYSWEDDPSCHVDCFGGPASCRNGVVIDLIVSAAPCWVKPAPGMQSVCERAAYTCAQGCREDFSRYWMHFSVEETSSFFPLLCVENTPTEGTPCTMDYQCFVLEGDATTSALRCDPDLKACVPTSED